MKTLLRAKILHILFLLLLLVHGLTACKVADRNTGSKPVGHQQWHALLQKHVTPRGLVDYKGFQQDSAALGSYLQQLSEHYPNHTHWSRQEQLAYWINAYNAFTVEIVLRHYPVESIKDISSTISIPFVSSVWDIKFIEIEGKSLSLNDIEHGILRKKFNEPRIHFAINCASVSCPELASTAYTAENLEQLLQQQSTAFLGNPEKNRISKEKLVVSKIFSWFSGDFTKNGSLPEFIQLFTETEISEDAEIDYMDYDWSLNDVSGK